MSPNLYNPHFLLENHRPQPDPVILTGIIYVCIFVRMFVIFCIVCLFVCMPVSLYVCMSVRLNFCMLFMYVCMFGCLRVCMCVFFLNNEFLLYEKLAATDWARSKYFFFIFLSFWLSFYLSFFFIYVFIHFFYHFIFHFFIIFSSSGAKKNKKMENCNFPRVFFIFLSFLVPVVELMKNDGK